ncbi:MAG TPA: PIN domain-containing protein [Stellaceae bacterium]|jgi:predicted nucleic acid-binding protein|nr:PIN domain-containing protein [Stellaceae bacterium]
MAGSFFDTNVLLYLASGNTTKADRAEELIASGGAISVQVLNEIANVGRRKMTLSWTDLHAFLGMFRSLLDVKPVTLAIHEQGLILAERYTLSTFDAMIVASALDADCDRLWSEDMHHGLVIDTRLRIENPFRA